MALTKLFFPTSISPVAKVKKRLLDIIPVQSDINPVHPVLKYTIQHLSQITKLLIASGSNFYLP